MTLILVLLFCVCIAAPSALIILLGVVGAASGFNLNSEETMDDGQKYPTPATPSRPLSGDRFFAPSVFER